MAASLPILLYVYVVVNMLHAVAVVAVALGAVAELHIGVVCVGNAAHSALVEVTLPLLDLLLGLLEVDGLGPGLIPLRRSAISWYRRQSRQ